MTGDHFDLDTSIAAWRRTLENRPSIEMDDLEELEQHVRDQIADLTKHGLSEQAAFERAMYDMGAPETAAAEYGKVYWGKMHSRGRLRDAVSARIARARNYFAVATRMFWRQKASTLVSVFGLAVALATCLLVGLYAEHEFTFDRFHERADEIYRIVWGHDLGGSALVPAHGATRLGDMPGVDDYVRIHPASVIIQRGDLRFKEEEFYYADASFFELFTFPLLAGDPARVLQEPNAVVLSESATKRYFGEENPVGETLSLPNGTTLEVTGVVRDAPTNSILQYDMVASYNTLGDSRDRANDEAGWTYQSWLYLAFSSESDVRRFEDHVSAITGGATDSEASALGFAVPNMYFELQPLTDIRLYPSPSGTVQPTGDVRYVFIFLAVGLLILIIAGGNYVNLATATSLQRAQEVGIRKALGAQRRQLVWQFFCEAALVCGVAFILALALALTALPAFDALHGADIGLGALATGRVITATAGLAVLTALAGGLYPAAILSRYSPFASLERTAAGPRSGAVRKGLVIFQFSLSTVLIVGTIVVDAQMKYVSNARLGYETAHIIKLPIPTTDANARFSGSAAPATRNRGRILKQALLQTPGVEQASISSGFPVEYVTGRVNLDDQPVEVRYVSADPDYVQTMGMDVLAGANFSDQLSGDLPRGVVVNETMARLWDLQDKVGQPLDLNLLGADRRLLAIVADFHTASLHQPIDPTVLLVEPDWFHAIVLRLDGGQFSSAVASVRRTWQRLVPDRPFEPEYLDEQLAQLYQSEQRLALLIGVGSPLAILIACLGLFSLTALSIEHRRKEVGVRKVLGASVAGIVKLFATDVVRLAVVAFVVAAPVAYVLMRRWLNDFAFRIEIDWWMFAMAGALTVTVAIVTVSYQSFKAALVDPARSLRQE